MKCIKVELPRELSIIKLHTLSDLHIGDKNCDFKKVKETIKEIESDPNAFVIVNGDILNNSTKTSIGDCYSEKLSPMQQIRMGVELLQPIKGKIVGMTAGNHEMRTYNKEGIDLSALMASELGLDDRYANEGAVIFLRFGKQSGLKETGNQGVPRMLCYTIYATHGSGGGRKEGAKAIRLADMASIVDADIYIHGHTHLPMIMRQSFFRTDVRNSSVQYVDRLFVNTSAMLDYGGYGQRGEFKPSSKETPIIYLDGTRKMFTARL